MALLTVNYAITPSTDIDPDDFLDALAVVILRAGARFRHSGEDDPVIECPDEAVDAFVAAVEDFGPEFSVTVHRP